MDLQSWILVITLAIAALQAILSVLQARTAGEIKAIREYLLQNPK